MKLKFVSQQTDNITNKSNMSTSNPSIFHLSKTNQTGELQTTTTKIHTVNFESVGELTNDGLQNYFDTRFQFLKQSYEYAKHLKVNENRMFVDDSATQVDMGLWLKANGDKSMMITGTEFGVITTKVRESIASIAKNPYITGLKNSFLEFFIRLEYPGQDWDIKNKRNKTKEENAKVKKNEKFLKEEIKKLNKNRKDKNILFLRNIKGGLTEQKIIELCNYELFQTVDIWIGILDKLQSSDKLHSLFDETLYKNLIDFKVEYTILIGNIMLELKAFVERNAESITDILDTFVDQFYFTFDPKIRELEAIHCTAINELSNRFLQSLKVNISDFNPDIYNDQNNSIISNSLYNLTKLDYLKLSTVDNFIEILENLINAKFDKLEKQQKDNSNLFKSDNRSLVHPKSAPRYPSIAEKVIGWSSHNCTSKLIDENSNFNSNKFLDYLLFRCKSVIENTEAYQIYQFLTDEEFVWADILNLKNNNQNDQKLGLKSFNINKLKIKKIELKTGKNNSETKYIYNITFWFKKDEEKQNIKFLPVSFSSLNNLNDNQVIELLYAKLTREINQIQLSQIELKLYFDLIPNLNLGWVDQWIDLVKLSLNFNEAEKKRHPNYARQTEVRLKELTQPQLQDILIIMSKIESKLQTLETHLLLSQDHNYFKVFDKKAFKQYQNLSQIVFESLTLDPKVLRQKKANLAKLTLDREVVIPVKIDRMTNRTNGNSTLAFEISKKEGIWQIKENSVKQNNGYIIIKPIKIKHSGQEIKIVDSIEKAEKELSKNPNLKILAGFLNGSGDTFFGTDFHQVKGENDEILYSDVLNKDGSQKLKGYNTYQNWELKEEVDGNTVSFKDSKRGNLETVGATSPAGYPKLYFFLVTQDCNNLVIPVTTNFYYLTKYTPYHRLNEYLKIISPQQDQTLEQKIVQTKKVLKLRCEIRSFYRISSIEADLIQKLTLIKGVITPKLFAKAHMQFGNPQVDITVQFTKPENNEKGKKVDITKIRKEDFESRYDNILGVDLGEKLLASISIIPIKNAQGNLDLSKQKPIVQTFLPVHDKDTVETKSTFTKILENSSSKKEYINEEKDLSFNRFNKIIKKYEKEQKQFGVVTESLKNKKKNLTDNLIEKISSQITKLCIAYRAFPVFENLPTGFKGSNKYQLSLYTEIYRQTINKLIKTGAVIDFDFEKYQPSNIDKGIANVRAFGTSKTCSNCGYIPFRFNPEKIYEDYNLDAKKGLTFNDDNWEDKGILEVFWNDQSQEGKNDYTKLLQITKLGEDDSVELIVEIVDINGKSRLIDLQFKTYFYKNKTNSIPKSTYEGLFENLITPETKLARKITDTAKSFILKNILNPRTSQADYECPRCNNKCNADYQASQNIANKFIRAIFTEFNK